MDLVIQDPENVVWEDGFLTVELDTVIQGATAATPTIRPAPEPHNQAGYHAGESRCSEDYRPVPNIQMETRCQEQNADHKIVIG